MQNAAYSRFTIAKFLIFCQSAHADAKPGYDNARCYAIQITATRSCNCECVAISRYISETMQASAKVVCCYCCSYYHRLLISVHVQWWTVLQLYKQHDRRIN